MAVRFHLILNEMWVVPREQAEQVGSDLHELRWAGGDAEFTAYLDDHAAYKVHSLLPHGHGQGELLEGLVVQACRTSSAALCSLQVLSGSLLTSRGALLAGLHEFSATMALAPPTDRGSFAPPDSSGPISNITDFLQEQLSSSSSAATGGSEIMSPLQQLFQYLLTDIPKTKLRFFNFKRIQRGNNISFIIHVHQDQRVCPVSRNGSVYPARETLRRSATHLQQHTLLPLLADPRHLQMEELELFEAHILYEKSSTQFVHRWT